MVRRLNAVDRNKVQLRQQKNIGPLCVRCELDTTKLERKRNIVADIHR